MKIFKDNQQPLSSTFYYLSIIRTRKNNNEKIWKSKIKCQKVNVQEELMRKKGFCLQLPS